MCYNTQGENARSTPYKVILLSIARIAGADRVSRCRDLQHHPVGPVADWIRNSMSDCHVERVPGTITERIISLSAGLRSSMYVVKSYMQFACVCYESCSLHDSSVSSLSV